MRHLPTPSLLVALLLLSGLSCFSGNIVRRCSSAEVLERQLKADPTMRQRMDQIETFTQRIIGSSTHRNSGSSSANLPSSITIPVVVHVLYNNEQQNVTDAMITAQIAVLNKDYSAMNADISKIPSVFSPLKANTNIQFCLAQTDPSGKTTTGIVRKSTTVAAFIDDDKMKFASSGGDNAWDASKYLNIWICNLANGLLGYAQFPGGAANTDGIVIIYSSLPGGNLVPYNQGRSATHEVGHWLNLHHIWGDDNCGDDLVSDTPVQQSPNFGCPVYPHASCTNSGDMSMNYMDYTDDECMYMFTQGQSARINALFAAGGVRASILNSNACMPPSAPVCEVPQSIGVTSVTSSGAVLYWSNVTGAVNYIIQYKKSTESAWTSASSTTSTKILSALSAGTTYNFRVQTICSEPGSFSNTGSFTTLHAAVGCGVPSGLTVNTVNSTSAALSWNAVSGATKYNVQYKTASAANWETVTTNTNSKPLTPLSAGITYNYKVQAVCKDIGAYSAPSSFVTPLPNGCSDVYEPNNNFSNAVVIPANMDLKGQISSNTDVDWYKFTNSSTLPNIKVTLTNLPKDYDVELYNASGIFLIMSDNGGTASEAIVYNNAPVGTYYIKVLGYGNSFSSSCYTLKAQTTNSFLKEVEPVDSKSSLRNDKKVTIYPNPSMGEFNIKYMSDADKKVTMTVYDLSGSVLWTQIVECTKGENLQTMSLKHSATGLYLMDVNDGTENKIYKMVINK
jgi:hypothetical protein